MLLKKSSCIFVTASFLPASFLHASFCVHLSLLLLSRYDTANEYITYVSRMDLVSEDQLMAWNTLQLQSLNWGLGGKVVREFLCYIYTYSQFIYFSLSPQSLCCSS